MCAIPCITVMRPSDRDAQIYIKKLRSSEAAICIQNLGATDFYIAHARGDWWLTTDRTKPRNVSEIGWDTKTIYNEIDNADALTPMNLLEAPFGHLIAHHPDSRPRTPRTL